VIEVDLHAHSLFSLCGLHTIIELLQYARDKGMKGLAVTDHGPLLNGRVNSVFFERLKDPVEGIILLKGMECNLAEKRGVIDFPVQFLQFTDIVLLGFHHNIEKGSGKKVYTDMMISALENNPYVDIITHPNDPVYEFDFQAVAEKAQELGMVFELNNSKLLLNRVDRSKMEKMILICIKAGCRMALCSDTHALNELGRDDFLIPLIEKMEIPEQYLVNNTASKGFQFIEERRKIKEGFKIEE